MTTFAVTPGAPYRISVSQPQVAGTPTPSISYAWSLAGVPIGSGRIINYTFDGDGLPATLRCVITLSNVAGSVSRTLEATIQAAANLPVLNAITIRDNATPTTIIDSVPIESGDGHIGRVLRVGGPVSADLNPTGSNFSALSYQWRRGGAIVTGATTQTYTISEADENTTVSVAVTATNTDESTSRTASVVVGELSEKLPYGDHIGYVNYYDTNMAFANLIHSTIGAVCGIGFNLAFVGRGVAGAGEQLRFSTSDWTGKPEICTADGWLTRSLTGELSNSNSARINLSAGWQRLAEMLQLPIEYDQFPLQPPEPYVDSNGQTKYRWPYPVADSLNGRTFKYVLSTYWEGTGYVHWNFYDTSDNTDGNQRLTPSVVTFAESPFADGRTNVQMSKVSKEFTVTFPISDINPLIGHIIEESDPNDPVRNMLALVSDVREVVNPADPSSDIAIYDGFDESNYTPFAMYPSAKKKFQRAAVLRTVQLGYAHATKNEYRDNTLAWEAVRDENGDIINSEYFKSGSTVDLYPTYRSVVSPKKHPCGAEFGLEALCRPTHAAFSHSLRAMIEICNQCDCDLWWNHPMWAMYIGTQTEGGVVYPTRAENPPDPNDPEQTGYLTVDPDYADWFVSQLQYLKPGLKVYSEFVNELWNTGGKFWLPNLFSYSWALKGLADPAFGGDGQPLWSNTTQRTIGEGGRFAGTTINKVSWKFGPAVSILGSCHLAKAFRDRNAPREIVAVAGFRGQTPLLSGIEVLEDVFALQPYLLKHLDALAIAPYRGPHNLHMPPEYPSTTQMAIIFREVYGGVDEAWTNQVEVQGAHKPITDATSFWRGDQYLPFLTAWKRISLDLANDEDADGYSARWAFGRTLPAGWSASRRRWNLRLMAYECGTATSFAVKPREVPLSTLHWAYEREHKFHFDPRHRMYARRYWEWLFSPGPKGLTDDPVTADDQLLYRSGLRPAGISAEQEPMCSPSLHLLTTQRLAMDGGAPTVVWSNQISTNHTTAPPQQGLEDAKAMGVGLPNWWVNYDYGA